MASIAYIGGGLEKEFILLEAATLVFTCDLGRKLS